MYLELDMYAIHGIRSTALQRKWKKLQGEIGALEGGLVLEEKERGSL